MKAGMKCWKGGEKVHKMMDELIDKIAREIAEEIVSDGRAEP